MPSPLHDLILAADDIESELVSVPEWDCEIELRGLDVASRSDVLKLGSALDGATVDFAKFWPIVVISTAHDPKTGERIFELTDLDALALKSAAVVERLGRIAIRISKLNPEAIDELGKASSTTPNGASSSTSLKDSDAQ